MGFNMFPDGHLAFLALPTAAYVLQPVSKTADDLPLEIRAKIKASVDRFVTDRNVANRSANLLAMDCLLATGLLARGDARMISVAENRLSQLRGLFLNDDVRIGWGSIAGQAAYGFQTSLAIMCLAQAKDIDPEAPKLASWVMRAWLVQARSANACPNCLFFPTGAAKTEANRYVRNVNVLMGLAGALTGENGIADGVVAAETFERKNKNFGYLSVVEPLWSQRPNENMRIENHATAVAAGLLSISRLKNSADVSQLAVAVYRAWAACQERRCVSLGCRYWAAPVACTTQTAAYAHCAFRQLLTSARVACELLLSNADSYSPSALLFILTGDRDPAS